MINELKELNKEQLLEILQKNIEKDKHFLIKSNINLNRKVQELEKERSEWKGKYSILKNKYRALQKEMNNRWRYNRALENESRTNEVVLEEFREQNKRYKQALEFYANEENYKPFDGISLSSYQNKIDEDGGHTARQVLEGRY